MNPIYTTAKKCLEQHITLDMEVPNEVGCAEAVSYILNKAGIAGIPAEGFQSTYDLYLWLKNNQNFCLSTTPSLGAVIVSPTGTSTLNSPHGHTGICGQYGILSNDSNTGLFLEIWTVDKWEQYYGETLGFPIYFFNIKNI